ncbi:MAG: LemA family protein [Candidatus Peribacteraceae bacterium]|jgi:LemA protein
MKKSLLWIILAVVALVLFYMWSGYNGFVTANERVDAQWAQVETQYQRRADLVPNLVSTVKGAAEFEQSTFVEVTQARTQWLNAEGRSAKIDAAQSFDGALSRLLVTFENYPQLQATQAYRDLMAQLEGTENRIAVARRDFNEAVQTFNVKVKRFPGNMIARLFGFEPQVFFAAQEGADVAPTVEF